MFSQELRLAANDGPFGWVAGLFYSNEDLRENFYSDLTDRLGGIAVTTYEQVANSLGVFAQGNYQFTDSLKATLGVREDHESRELIGLNTAFLPGRAVTHGRRAGRLDHFESAFGQGGAGLQTAVRARCSMQASAAASSRAALPRTTP